MPPPALSHPPQTVGSRAPTDPICRAVLCMLRGRKRIGCGVGGAEAVSSLSAAMLVVVCIAHIW